MFSGHLARSAISLGAGAAVGFADAVGFYYTAHLFLVRATSSKRTLAGILEAARLIGLIAVVAFLYTAFSMAIFWLLTPAILLSLGGKFFFIFKRLRVQ